MKYKNLKELENNKNVNRKSGLTFHYIINTFQGLCLINSKSEEVTLLKAPVNCLFRDWIMNHLPKYMSLD